MKITIEHEGQVIEFTDDHIEPGTMRMNSARDYIESACPDGCGCAHRAFVDGGSLSITAKLSTVPAWRSV